MDWWQTPSRRGFLQASAAALAAPTFARTAPRSEQATVTRIVFVNLVGGPSQLDTFDPKPAAPVDIRGPFRPMPTSVPGICLSELLPRTARLAHHLVFLRTLHHEAAPIHETGQQLTQTGRLAVNGVEPPNWSALLASQLPAGAVIPCWLLPGPLRNTGVMISHGQAAGPLGERWSLQVPPPLLREPHDWLSAREEFGDSAFGRACWQALRLLERGPAFITINMFDTVFDQPTWDCHADGASLGTTLREVGSVVAPQFDWAFAALVEGVRERGLWGETLLVATGEFGRTPRLNRRGGRDHWPYVWSAVLAGGPLPGGVVGGRSDSLGAYPDLDPLPPASLPALLAHAAGLPGLMGPIPNVLRRLWEGRS
jgi:hypothetical protein